jgi:hypothetical protein
MESGFATRFPNTPKAILNMQPRGSSVLCRFPALPGEEISTNQFPNKFQYSNFKNQTENKSVCDLKFGFENYLEIGLWKFGRARLQRKV